MEICCPECSMFFPSHNLLSKHQTQFCVGPSSAIDQLQASVTLEEASTHRNAKTYAGNVFVTCDLDLLIPK